MHVLLIEDDHLVAGGIVAGLRLLALTVNHVDNAAQALAALHFNVCMLDLGLPDVDGMVLLARWRAQGQAIPVLVLMARDVLNHRDEGPQAGADDYLLKPFELDEPVARLHALVRRTGSRCSNLVERGSPSLNASSAEVRGLAARLPAERLQLGGAPALPLDVIARGCPACEVSLMRGEVAIQPIARNATRPGLEGATLGYSTRIFGGKPWHTYVLQDGEVRIATANRTDARQGLLREIALGAAAPSAVAMAGSPVLLWIGVGHRLAPIERVRTAQLNRRADVLHATHQALADASAGLPNEGVDSSPCVGLLHQQHADVRKTARTALSAVGRLARPD